MNYLCLAALLLAFSSCRPDKPAADQAKSVPSSLAASPSRDTALAHPTDTLQLPGGLVRLLPASGVAFSRLPGSGLPELTNDSLAEVAPLALTRGRVRRQGLNLLFSPDQGPVVSVASTPMAEYTLANSQGVRYQYQGSLPAAHQWVIRAWYWESSGTLLVDQRTGRRLEVLGNPVASPDGRLVLLTSTGLSGGDQANALSLVAIREGGPQLLWQREPSAWEPQQARWVSPKLALLQLRYAGADGSVADNVPVSYVQLPMPR